MSYTVRKWLMRIMLAIVLIAAGLLFYLNNRTTKEAMSFQELSAASQDVSSDTVSYAESSTLESVPDSSETGKVSSRNEVSSDSRMICVHVSGAVKNPDRLYYLPEGSRIADAIEAAGGAREDACFTQVNLAQVLLDGMKITIPFLGQENITVAVLAESDHSGGKNSGESTGNGLTDLNLADKIDLEKLPGIGPSLAERIVAWREANGRFHSIEEIKNVSGIGDKLFERIKDLISVS